MKAARAGPIKHVLQHYSGARDVTLAQQAGNRALLKLQNKIEFWKRSGRVAMTPLSSKSSLCMIPQL